MSRCSRSPRAAPSAEDALCEVWFAILALVWIAQMIAPSTRRKMAGYGQGQARNVTNRGRQTQEVVEAGKGGR